ncbi:MAG: hypothetical protein HN783_06830 [Ilumatobacter sp.]|nr:hypothetical protein [Ilumatobacter sp.]
MRHVPGNQEQVGEHPDGSLGLQSNIHANIGAIEKTIRCSDDRLQISHHLVVEFGQGLEGRLAQITFGDMTINAAVFPGVEPALQSL